MDFKSAKELLGLCHENHMAISEVMKRRECTLGETTLCSAAWGRYWIL